MSAVNPLFGRELDTKRSTRDKIIEAAQEFDQAYWHHVHGRGPKEAINTAALELRAALAQVENSAR